MSHSKHTTIYLEMIRLNSVCVFPRRQKKKKVFKNEDSHSLIHIDGLSVLRPSRKILQTITVFITSCHNEIPLLTVM